MLARLSRHTLLPSLALLLLAGCPSAREVPDVGPRDALPGKDAAVSRDAAEDDAAEMDSGEPDGGEPDAESRDAEPTDAAPADAEPMDAESMDAEVMDVGSDGGQDDAGPEDSGVSPVPVAPGALAFTKIRATATLPAVDAVLLTNVSTVAVQVDHLIVRVDSQAAGADLEIVASNDPSGALQTPVILQPGDRAIGIANRSVVELGADFLIGAPSSLATDFLAAGDRIELANAGGASIDVVDFTQTATGVTVGPDDFPLVPEAAIQLDVQAVTSSAAQLNDGGGRWCTDLGRAPFGGANTDCERFLINELLYDYDSIAGGVDQGQELVEISGPIGGRLTDVLLTAVEGTGASAGNVDREIPIGPARIPLDGLFVIADDDAGGTFVPNADLVTDLDLENGPDAVQLIHAPPAGVPVLHDAVAYGAVVVVADALRGLDIVEGTPLPDPAPGIYPIAFARIDGIDSGDNAIDFDYDPSPTPGEENDGAAFELLAVTPARAPVGATVDVTLSGVDFTDGMTVLFDQNPAPAITCGNAPAPNMLACTVAYPQGGAGIGEAIDVVLISRPELGATSTLSAAFVWEAAINETDTGPECDYCNLQFPPAVTTAVDQPTPLIYGQIYEAGLTDFIVGGPAPGIIAELGYGPVGSDPRASPAWIWVPAPFNGERGPGNNNDEFQASLTVSAAGSYLYTYRYSLDGGLSFSYGDLDGAGSNGGLDFDPSLLGALTVN